jgi:hypothetical protein
MDTMKNGIYQKSHTVQAVRRAESIPFYLALRSPPSTSLLYLPHSCEFYPAICFCISPAAVPKQTARYPVTPLPNGSFRVRFRDHSLDISAEAMT